MPSPQQVNWAKFRASSVIVAGLLILGTVALLLTGGTVLQPKTLIYLYLPDATGVSPGSPVRVDGIGVGKVSLVELSGSNEPARVVRVVMNIDTARLVSITSDSTAETTSDTLIGDKFVDVTSGTSLTHLNAGAEIQYKGGADMMQRLDLAQFQQRLHVIEVLLDDIEAGRGPLGEFIKGDSLYNDLRTKVSALQRGIQVAADTTTAVGQALYTDALYRKVMDPLRELDQSLAKLQAGQGTGGAMLHDAKQYDQAVAQVKDLRNSLGGMAGGEMMKSDAAYAGWIVRLEGVMQQVAEFNASPMLTNSSVYDNFAGMAKELQSTSKDFRENPRKYLRLKVF